MKKITLFLTVTCFAVAASAQQNDFFDIQKHLQKKRKENMPVINPLLVKPLFQNQVNLFHSVNVNNQRNFSHTLSNGDKVYLLAQDNMPCIIPDMREFMRPYTTGLIKNPAFSPNNNIGKIPNAAIPQRTIITK